MMDLFFSKSKSKSSNTSSGTTDTPKDNSNKNFLTNVKSLTSAQFSNFETSLLNEWEKLYNIKLNPIEEKKFIINFSKHFLNFNHDLYNVEGHPVDFLHKIYLIFLKEFIIFNPNNLTESSSLDQFLSQKRYGNNSIKKKSYVKLNLSCLKEIYTININQETIDNFTLYEKDYEFLILIHTIAKLFFWSHNRDFIFNLFGDTNFLSIIITLLNTLTKSLNELILIWETPYKQYDNHILKSKSKSSINLNETTKIEDIIKQPSQNLILMTNYIISLILACLKILNSTRKNGDEIISEIDSSYLSDGIIGPSNISYNKSKILGVDFLLSNFSFKKEDDSTDDNSNYVYMDYSLSSNPHDDSTVNRVSIIMSLIRKLFHLSTFISPYIANPIYSEENFKENQSPTPPTTLQSFYLLIHFTQLHVLNSIPVIMSDPRGFIELTEYDCLSSINLFLSMKDIMIHRGKILKYIPLLKNIGMLRSLYVIFIHKMFHVQSSNTSYISTTRTKVGFLKELESCFDLLGPLIHLLINEVNTEREELISSQLNDFNIEIKEQISNQSNDYKLFSKFNDSDKHLISGFTHEDFSLMTPVSEILDLPLDLSESKKFKSQMLNFFGTNQTTNNSDSDLGASMSSTTQTQRFWKVGLHDILSHSGLQNSFEVSGISSNSKLDSLPQPLPQPLNPTRWSSYLNILSSEDLFVSHTNILRFQEEYHKKLYYFSTNHKTENFPSTLTNDPFSSLLRFPSSVLIIHLYLFLYRIITTSDSSLSGNAPSYFEPLLKQLVDITLRVIKEREQMIHYNSKEFSIFHIDKNDVTKFLFPLYGGESIVILQLFIIVSRSFSYKQNETVNALRISKFWQHIPELILQPLNNLSTNLVSHSYIHNNYINVSLLPSIFLDNSYLDENIIELLSKDSLQILLSKHQSLNQLPTYNIDLFVLKSLLSDIYFELLWTFSYNQIYYLQVKPTNLNTKPNLTNESTSLSSLFQSLNSNSNKKMIQNNFSIQQLTSFDDFEYYLLSYLESNILISNNNNINNFQCDVILIYRYLWGVSKISERFSYKSPLWPEVIINGLNLLNKFLPSLNNTSLNIHSNSISSSQLFHIPSVQSIYHLLSRLTYHQHFKGWASIFLVTSINQHISTFPTILNKMSFANVRLRFHPPLISKENERMSFYHYHQYLELHSNNYFPSSQPSSPSSSPSPSIPPTPYTSPIPQSDVNSPSNYELIPPNIEILTNHLLFFPLLNNKITRKFSLALLNKLIIDCVKYIDDIKYSSFLFNSISKETLFNSNYEDIDSTCIFLIHDIIKSLIKLFRISISIDTKEIHYDVLNSFISLFNCISNYFYNSSSEDETLILLRNIFNSYGSISNILKNKFRWSSSCPNFLSEIITSVDYSLGSYVLYYHKLYNNTPSSESNYDIIIQNTSNPNLFIEELHSISYSMINSLINFLIIYINNDSEILHSFSKLTILPSSLKLYFPLKHLLKNRKKSTSQRFNKKVNLISDTNNNLTEFFNPLWNNISNDLYHHQLFLLLITYTPNKSLDFIPLLFSLLYGVNIPNDYFNMIYSSFQSSITLIKENDMEGIPKCSLSFCSCEVPLSFYKLGGKLELNNNTYSVCFQCTSSKFHSHLKEHNIFPYTIKNPHIINTIISLIGSSDWKFFDKFLILHLLSFSIGCFTPENNTLDLATIISSLSNSNNNITMNDNKIIQSNSIIGLILDLFITFSKSKILTPYSFYLKTYEDNIEEIHANLHITTTDIKQLCCEIIKTFSSYSINTSDLKLIFSVLNTKKCLNCLILPSNNADLNSDIYQDEFENSYWYLINTLSGIQSNFFQEPQSYILFSGNNSGIHFSPFNQWTPSNGISLCLWFSLSLTSKDFILYSIMGTSDSISNKNQKRRRSVKEKISDLKNSSIILLSLRQLEGNGLEIHIKILDSDSSYTNLRPCQLILFYFLNNSVHEEILFNFFVDTSLNSNNTSLSPWNFFGLSQSNNVVSQRSSFFATSKNNQTSFYFNKDSKSILLIPLSILENIPLYNTLGCLHPHISRENDILLNTNSYSNKSYFSSKLFLFKGKISEYYLFTEALPPTFFKDIFRAGPRGLYYLSSSLHNEDLKLILGNEISIQARNSIVLGFNPLLKNSNFILNSTNSIDILNVSKDFISSSSSLSTIYKINPLVIITEKEYLNGISCTTSKLKITNNNDTNNSSNLNITTVLSQISSSNSVNQANQSTIPNGNLDANIYINYYRLVLPSGLIYYYKTITNQYNPSNINSPLINHFKIIGIPLEQTQLCVPRNIKNAIESIGGVSEILPLILKSKDFQSPKLAISYIEKVLSFTNKIMYYTLLNKKYLLQEGIHTIIHTLESINPSFISVKIARSLNSLVDFFADEIVSGINIKNSSKLNVGVANDIISEESSPTSKGISNGAIWVAQMLKTIYFRYSLWSLTSCVTQEVIYRKAQEMIHSVSDIMRIPFISSSPVSSIVEALYFYYSGDLLERVNQFREHSESILNLSSQTPTSAPKINTPVFNSESISEVIHYFSINFSIENLKNYSLSYQELRSIRSLLVSTIYLMLSSNNNSTNLLSDISHIMGYLTIETNDDFKLEILQLLLALISPDQANLSGNLLEAFSNAKILLLLANLQSPNVSLKVNLYSWICICSILHLILHHNYSFLQQNTSNPSGIPVNLDDHFLSLSQKFDKSFVLLGVETHSLGNWISELLFKVFDRFSNVSDSYVIDSFSEIVFKSLHLTIFGFSCKHLVAEIEQLDFEYIDSILNSTSLNRNPNFSKIESETKYEESFQSSPRISYAILINPLFEIINFYKMTNKLRSKLFNYFSISVKSLENVDILISIPLWQVQCLRLLASGFVYTILSSHNTEYEKDKAKIYKRKNSSLLLDLNDLQKSVFTFLTDVHIHLYLYGIKRGNEKNSTNYSTSNNYSSRETTTDLFSTSLSSSSTPNSTTNFSIIIPQNDSIYFSNPQSFMTLSTLPIIVRPPGTSYKFNYHSASVRDYIDFLRKDGRGLGCLAIKALTVSLRSLLNFSVLSIWNTRHNIQSNNKSSSDLFNDYFSAKIHSISKEIAQKMDFTRSKKMFELWWEGSSIQLLTKILNGFNKEINFLKANDKDAALNLVRFKILRVNLWLTIQSFCDYIGGSNFNLSTKKNFKKKYTKYDEITLDELILSELGSDKNETQSDSPLYSSILILSPYLSDWALIFSMSSTIQAMPVDTSLSGRDKLRTGFSLGIARGRSIRNLVSSSVDHFITLNNSLNTTLKTFSSEDLSLFHSSSSPNLSNDDFGDILDYELNGDIDFEDDVQSVSSDESFADNRNTFNYQDETLTIENEKEEIRSNKVLHTATTYSIWSFLNILLDLAMMGAHEYNFIDESKLNSSVSKVNKESIDNKEYSRYEISLKALNEICLFIDVVKTSTFDKIYEDVCLFILSKISSTFLINTKIEIHTSWMHLIIKLAIDISDQYKTKICNDIKAILFSSPTSSFSSVRHSSFTSTKHSSPQSSFSLPRTNTTDSDTSTMSQIEANAIEGDSIGHLLSKISRVLKFKYPSSLPPSNSPYGFSIDHWFAIMHTYSALNKKRVYSSTPSSTNKEFRRRSSFFSGSSSSTPSNTSNAIGTNNTINNMRRKSMYDMNMIQQVLSKNNYFNNVFSRRIKNVWQSCYIQCIKSFVSRYSRNSPVSIYTSSSREIKCFFENELFNNYLGEFQIDDKLCMCLDRSNCSLWATFHNGGSGIVNQVWPKTDGSLQQDQKYCISKDSLPKKCLYCSPFIDQDDPDSNVTWILDSSEQGLGRIRRKLLPVSSTLLNHKLFLHSESNSSPIEETHVSSVASKFSFSLKNHSSLSRKSSQTSDDLDFQVKNISDLDKTIEKVDGNILCSNLDKELNSYFESIEEIDIDDSKLSDTDSENGEIVKIESIEDENLLPKKLSIRDPAIKPTLSQLFPDNLIDEDTNNCSRVSDSCTNSSISTPFTINFEEENDKVAAFDFNNTNSQNQIESIKFDNEKLFFNSPCSIITAATNAINFPINGNLKVSKSSIIFSINFEENSKNFKDYIKIDNNLTLNVTNSNGIMWLSILFFLLKTNSPALFSFNYPKNIKWPTSLITNIQLRFYHFLYTSIEIFTTLNTSFFLNFPDTMTALKFINVIKKFIKPIHLLTCSGIKYPKELLNKTSVVTYSACSASSIIATNNPNTANTNVNTAIVMNKVLLSPIAFTSAMSNSSTFNIFPNDRLVSPILTHPYLLPGNTCNNLLPTSSNLISITNAWVNRLITNFDYLMLLNSIAGRSFNSLSQYPIFPWVLKDYESSTLDLKDPTIYRNFSYPISAQTEAQREASSLRYEDMLYLYEDTFNNIEETLKAKRDEIVKRKKLRKKKLEMNRNKIKLGLGKFKSRVLRTDISPKPNTDPQNPINSPSKINPTYLDFYSEEGNDIIDESPNPLFIDSETNQTESGISNPTSTSSSVNNNNEEEDDDEEDDDILDEENDDNDDEIEFEYSKFILKSSLIPPFHHGVHYSVPGYVIWWLLRLEPYTSLHVQLQNGKFDHADRLCSSLSNAWKGCQTNASDVKELIPEMYYLPEMFMNTNNINYGKTQDQLKPSLISEDSNKSKEFPTKPIDLPPWANNSPYEFVRLHREALESEYVSANIHNWIDLIFGYKQKPPYLGGSKASVEYFNTFFHLTYENSKELEKMKLLLNRIKVRLADINNSIQSLTKNSSDFSSLSIDEIKLMKKKLKKLNKLKTSFESYFSQIESLYQSSLNQISEYGQSPSVLFDKPHPQRKLLKDVDIVWPLASSVLGSSSIYYDTDGSIKENNLANSTNSLLINSSVTSSYSTCTLNKPNKIVCFKKETISTKPIVLIIDDEENNNLITVDSLSNVLYHLFNITSQDNNLNFRFKVDPYLSEIFPNLNNSSSSSFKLGTSSNYRLKKLPIGFIKKSEKLIFSSILSSSLLSSASLSFSLLNNDNTSVYTDVYNTIDSKTYEEFDYLLNKRTNKKVIDDSKYFGSPDIRNESLFSKNISPNSLPSINLFDTIDPTSHLQKPINNTISNILPPLFTANSPNSLVSRKSINKQSCPSLNSFSNLNSIPISDPLLSPDNFAYIPEWKLLFSSGHYDWTVRATYLDNARLAYTLHQHNDIVTCISLVKDYSRYLLVTGSKDCTINIWEIYLATQPLVKKSNLFNNSTFHSNSPIFQSSNSNLIINLLHTINSHTDNITSLSTNIDYDLLVSASEDGTICLHSLRTGKFIQKINRFLYPKEIETTRKFNSSLTKLNDFGKSSVYSLENNFSGNNNLFQNSIFSSNKDINLNEDNDSDSNYESNSDSDSLSDNHYNPFNKSLDIKLETKTMKFILNWVGISKEGYILTYSSSHNYLFVFSINGHFINKIRIFEKILTFTFSTDEKVIITGGTSGVLAFRWVHDLSIANDSNRESLPSIIDGSSIISQSGISPSPQGSSSPTPIPVQKKSIVCDESHIFDSPIRTIKLTKGERYLIVGSEKGEIRILGFNNLLSKKITKKN